MVNDVDHAGIARVQQRTALIMGVIATITLVLEWLVQTAPAPWSQIIIGSMALVIPALAGVWWSSRRGHLERAGWVLLVVLYLTMGMSGVAGTLGSALTVLMTGMGLLLTLPENALPRGSRKLPWAWMVSALYMASVGVRQWVRGDLLFQSADDFFWVLLMPPACFVLMRMMMRRMMADLERAWRRSQETNEELVRSQIALEYAVAEAHNANAAKSQFLANMSHELRTPLTSVIGYAELLLEEDKAPQEVVVIREAGQHLLELISDVLDLSKIEAGHMTLHAEAFEASALCEELVTLMRPQLEAGRNELVTELTPVRLDTDRGKLRQILLNLLSNAAKFTEGGTIHLRLLPLGARVAFEVEDTGPGIDPEDLARVLRPFERAHADDVGGTGLGLALCVRLAELLGGELEVVSEPGRGSLFRVVVAAELG